MKLDLNDLVPEEASFSLSGMPGKVYVLKKFTLRDQIWVRQRFVTEAQVKKIFETNDLAGISEIVHHLLKDKTDFPTFLDFAESVVTPADKLAVQTGLLTTIGISQPLIDKLSAPEKEDSEVNPNPNELSPPK